MPALSEVNIGDRVQFTTHAAHDNTVWSGTVEAIGRYNAMFGAVNDIPAYHRDVSATHTGIGPYKQQTFFLMHMDKDQTTKACAFEWVDVSSLVINPSISKLSLEVYDVSPSDKSAVLKVLRDAGFKCGFV